MITLEKSRCLSALALYLAKEVQGGTLTISSLGEEAPELFKELSSLGYSNIDKDLMKLCLNREMFSLPNSGEEGTLSESALFLIGGI